MEKRALGSFLKECEEKWPLLVTIATVGFFGRRF